MRALVVADGALCQSAALRRLLESGTSLRFVERVEFREANTSGARLPQEGSGQGRE